MELTPSQKKALSSDRHLAITANAGSGKTRILVERFIDLFEQDPDLHVRNVLAITFTNNAAAELRTRILKSVKNRIAGLGEGEASRRARLVKLRDSLSSSFVSTIHGFATRMIRSYPVEAKVDAGFATLEGADERLLTEEAIEATLISAFEEALSLDGDAPKRVFFRTLDRRTVTDVLRSLLSNRARALALKKSFCDRSDDQVIADWIQALCELTPEAFDETHHHFFENGIRAHLRGTPSARALAQTLDAYYGTPPGKNLIRLVAFHKLIGAANFRMNNLFPRKADIPEFYAEVEQLAEDHETERTILGVHATSETALVVQDIEQALRDLLAHTRQFFALFEQVLAEYALRKEELTVLDYDDLILKLRDLLDNDLVCGELAAQFRYIMIDEYQDTDSTQYEVAAKLTHQFGRENNLAIVGDPKQSIYAFRNADASVFQLTQEKISEQSFEKEVLTALEQDRTLSAEERTGQIHLAESFRMAEQPLLFMNELFGKLMGKPELGFGLTQKPEYLPLVLGRPFGPALTRGSVRCILPNDPTATPNPAPPAEAAEQAEADGDTPVPNNAPAHDAQRSAAADSNSEVAAGDPGHRQLSDLPDAAAR